MDLTYLAPSTISGLSLRIFALIWILVCRSLLWKMLLPPPDTVPTSNEHSESANRLLKPLRNHAGTISHLVKGYINFCPPEEEHLRNDFSNLSATSSNIYGSDGIRSFSVGCHADFPRFTEQI